jgi:hypothetical protein
MFPRFKQGVVRFHNMTREEMGINLAAALELADVAETLLRERLLRTHPSWSSAQIEAAIDEWYHRRPGAAFGDAEGRPVSWPR